MTNEKMIKAAEGLIASQTPKVQAIVTDTYRALVVGSGCQPDVKTIYISFTKDELLVAAAHPDSHGVELALALPELHSSTLLEDASHLTWRTLPLLVRITDESDREEVLDLVYEAVSRVELGEHNVDRPPEFFQASRRSEEQRQFWKVR